MIPRSYLILENLSTLLKLFLPLSFVLLFSPFHHFPLFFIIIPLHFWYFCIYYLFIVLIQNRSISIKTRILHDIRFTIFNCPCCLTIFFSVTVPLGALFNVIMFFKNYLLIRELIYFCNYLIQTLHYIHIFLSLSFFNIS